MTLFQRERNSLPSANAKRHDPAFQAIALHRMQQPCRENRASGPDRVAMRDGATLHIDYVLGEAKLTGDCNRDGRKGFVDFDAVDVLD